MTVADKTYSIPEVKRLLAERYRQKVESLSRDIAALQKRELKKAGLMADAHFEPGKHEAAEAAVGEHLEPGGHEKFAMNPPAHPEGTDPIGQGIGTPPGAMGDTPIQDDRCALCGQPDQPGSCTCLQKSAPSMSGSAGAGTNAGNDAMAMAEANPGESDNHTKQVPTPPVPGSVLPPDSPKSIKSQDGKKPKKNNPLAKVDVPMAKPPSGKVPGASKAAPMSKPTVPKAPAIKPPPIGKPAMAGGPQKPPLGKAALPANPKQAQQHALHDASKVAGPKPVVPSPAKPLQHPGDQSRANAFQAAAAGAFQPKGPVVSGLELAGPKPKLAAPPKVGGKGLFGPGLGKSEKCALCGQSEHQGTCGA